MTMMITKCGQCWQPDQEQVLKWVRVFPDVDVYQELNSMSSWLDANTSKRKTLRGIPRFCNSWLSRAQEKGGSPEVKARKARKIIATRDMTMADMLSHDWAHLK